MNTNDVVPAGFEPNRRIVRDRRGRSRASGVAGSLLLTLLGSAVAALSPSPASAATAADLCDGHWVKRLGGSHAVTRKPIDDLAELRRRLPELEASIRTVVGMDPSLGPVVADALIATIRDGAGMSERSMRRDESMRWMAYQPKPGQFGAIMPACLRLERSYDSFEISVEIPEPALANPAAACAVSAIRDCALENPKIMVNLRGSSPGARVTMSAGGQPAVAIGGQGESFTIDDPGPYERDAVFTVRAQGGPAAARTARVFRFLMPKICGNLAYLGEDPKRTIAAAGEPESCEKSARVALCSVPVAPVPPVEQQAVADICEDSWVTRPFLFAFMPNGDAQERDIPFGRGTARERFEMDSGYGVGISVEKRMGPVFGLEGTAMVGRGDSEYRLESNTASGTDTHVTNFYALTFGPNFHLLGCGGADLYVGPFLGYGGFADPNYWALDHHFRASFDGGFVWGAQLGLDVPFDGDGPWGFHGGLRYIKLSQDTDAGSMDIDPLIVELGFTYRR